MRSLFEGRRDGELVARETRELHDQLTGGLSRTTTSQGSAAL